MKTYKYILFALATLTLASCFKDESTDATNPIAEITIDESNLMKVYNINKNDSLIISPVVTQSNKELPLYYAWELDQVIVSTEKEFRYKGDILGTYNGRLIVSNDDGKAFYTFTLNVNSPYEYGIMVLSKDTDGRPHIAFMQEPLEEGGEKKFYDENCLEKNNTDQFFASNPSDIIQTTGTLIVACQGNDNDSEDGAAIYFLNEKTFVMENLVESNEYKDFKPTRLLTPQGSYEGSAYPVLSADGKMYSLPTYNAVLQPSHKLTSTYAQAGFAIGGDRYNDIVVWDNEVNDFVCLYNSYGPYYCGAQYLLTRDSLMTDEYYKKNFSKLKGLNSLTPIRRTAEQEKNSRLQFVAIVKGALATQKVIMGSFFWEAVTGSYGKYNVYDKKKFTMDELMKALDADFVGYEAIHNMVTNKTPKYGNDDDYADEVMTSVFNLYQGLVTGRDNMRNGHWRINMLPTTCHVYFGEVCGALPNGRLAAKPLSEGISPEKGADTNGPTSVVKSCSKMDHLSTGGTLLNQKFTPSVVAGEQGLEQMANLIRTYFNLDGHHIQFNVIDKQTLIAAQQNPEEYKDLIVRVAGYSDYFRNLSKALQDEIIERTEQSFS